MKAAQTSNFTLGVMLGFFVSALPRPASAQPAPEQNLGSLINEAKKGEFERKLAAKQTEADRLKEDLKKGAKEIESLDTRAHKAGGAADDSAKQLELLNLQKKRAAREMELLASRLEAERLKGESLRMLETANRKAIEAITRRNEENETKTAIVMAETRQIAAKAPQIAGETTPPVAIAKNEPSLTELHKKLAKIERAVSTAAYQAREAMTAATARLQDAENAAVRAEKKREEAGFGDNSPAAR